MNVNTPRQHLLQESSLPLCFSPDSCSVCVCSALCVSTSMTSSSAWAQRYISLQWFLLRRDLNRVRRDLCSTIDGFFSISVQPGRPRRAGLCWTNGAGPTAASTQTPSELWSATAGEHQPGVRALNQQPSRQYNAALAGADAAAC